MWPLSLPISLSIGLTCVLFTSLNIPPLMLSLQWFLTNVPMSALWSFFSEHLLLWSIWLAVSSSFLTPNFYLFALQGLQEADLRTRRRGEGRRCRENNKQTHIQSTLSLLTVRLQPPSRRGILWLSIYISVIKLSLQSTVPHSDIYEDGWRVSILAC